VEPEAYRILATLGGPYIAYCNLGTGDSMLAIDLGAIC